MAKKNNMLNFKKLASNKVVLYAVTLIALISIINYKIKYLLKTIPI